MTIKCVGSSGMTFAQRMTTVNEKNEKIKKADKTINFKQGKCSGARMTRARKRKPLRLTTQYIWLVGGACAGCGTPLAASRMASSFSSS